jgi:hypothetical protein
MRRFASTCFIQVGEIQHFPVRIAPLAQMITKPLFRIRKGGRNSDAFAEKRETADWRPLYSADVMQSALRGTRRSSADHDPCHPKPYSMHRDGNASQKWCSVIESSSTLPWCHTRGTHQALPTVSGVASLPRLSVARAVCNDACRTTGTGRPILVSRLACRAVCRQV